MKKIVVDIYEEYQIMPQLIEHQLRVAGVADLICENFNLSSPAGYLPKLGEKNIDRQAIVVACLLHDMGNIVKFDFTVFPEVVAEKGLEYWQEIKKTTMEKYGSDSHTATYNMLKEIGVEERILELVDCIGFRKGKLNAESQDFGKKICAYSDMRVMPQGVSSLEERFLDLTQRYKNHSEGKYNRQEFENGLRKIEKQIFAKCKIRPEDITDASIQPIVEKLKQVEV